MGKEEKNRAKEALELIMSRYGIAGQQEIATMLGFSNAYLSQLASGAVKMSGKAAAKFESHFGINPLWLMGKSDTPWSQKDTPPKAGEGNIDRDDLKIRYSRLTAAIKAKFGLKTEQEICSVLAVNNTYFSNIRMGRAGMRPNIKKQMEIIFGVNPDFIDGKSDEIFIAGAPTNAIFGNNNVQNSSNVSVNDTALTRKLMEENNELRKQLALANDQLATASEQLRKSQDHVSRLIAMLEKGGANG